MPIYTRDDFIVPGVCPDCGEDRGDEGYSCYCGCWHYDYQDFCTQCDPASYGPCEKDCPYEHVCCTCDTDECEVHPDQEEC